MPQIRSAKKRVQVAERNRIRNKNVKSAIRTAIKNVHTAVAEGADEAAIKEMINLVYSRIDKAVLKGIVHKNTAARSKSRLVAFTKREKSA